MSCLSETALALLRQRAEAVAAKMASLCDTATPEQRKQLLDELKAITDLLEDKEGSCAPIYELVTVGYT